MKVLDLGRVVGLSAYEIAVSKGYEGTIEEWLKSLRYDHSDEYKQFTETIEEARNEILSGKEEITSGKTEIESSISSVRDLVEKSMENITNAKNDGIDEVKAKETEVVQNINNAKDAAISNVTESETTALSKLSSALKSAVGSVDEKGTEWEQKIEDAGSSAQINYNKNADEKTEAFDTHVNDAQTALDKKIKEKQTAFDSNAESKQSEFDQNAETKQTTFDSNATEKQAAFDQNAELKQTAYNQNSETKLDAYNKNAADKTTEFDTHTEEIQNELVQLKKDYNTVTGQLDKLQEAVRDANTKTPHVNSIDVYYDMRRTGKVYQTKFWKYATNPTSVCEKQLDNAGLVFEPSTDTTEGKDDYLNGNHPLFEWVHCNYKRYDDGTAYPVTTEYDSAYKTSGAVDVGAMQSSFYWNWDTSNAEYDLVTISDMPNEKYGLKPWSECKRADGTVTPWCIGSAYVSGIASDGLPRSQPGLKPERSQSHNNIITNYAKKGEGYRGAGAERNTFQIIFNLIKGANKSSQTLYSGCTNYNYQYSASVQSAELHTYFPLTNEQAANIIVGSCVSVGYGDLNTAKDGVNNDRGIVNMHKYADNVKVLKMETLDENNKAVYLDIETGFSTMPVALSDTVNAPVTLSTMMWVSGTTDQVIGRHDGSSGSNTDGKHPYRVQGREYAIGAYLLASDTVMDFKSDYSKDVYIAPKGVARSTADATIRDTYTLLGNIPASTNGNGSDIWVGDIAVDVNTGGWFPSVQGSSDKQGYGDIVFAGGTATSGAREYLMGGVLGDGSDGGSAFLLCWNWLGWADWSCCSAD